MNLSSEVNWMFCTLTGVFAVAVNDEVKSSFFIPWLQRRAWFYWRRHFWHERKILVSQPVRNPKPATGLQNVRKHATHANICRIFTTVHLSHVQCQLRKVIAVTDETPFLSSANARSVLTFLKKRISSFRSRTKFTVLNRSCELSPNL